MIPLNLLLGPLDVSPAILIVRVCSAPSLALVRANIFLVRYLSRANCHLLKVEVEVFPLSSRDSFLFRIVCFRCLHTLFVGVKVKLFLLRFAIHARKVKVEIIAFFLAILLKLPFQKINLLLFWLKLQQVFGLCRWLTRVLKVPERFWLLFHAHSLSEGGRGFVLVIFKCKVVLLP